VTLPLSTAAEQVDRELFLIAIQRDMFRIELAKFMEHYPIICPSFCVTAFGHGTLEVDIDGEKCSLFEANWVNCAGLPAAVVPGGIDQDGLPIGVQVFGRAFEEETMLAIANALEQELGGFQHPPL
jgi:amidase